MQKHLYFVCPTDHLEAVINNKFRQENYYLTSLGNSITFDPELVDEINSIIESNAIREITFVLSDTNKMILDALKKQGFKDTRGLKKFHHLIAQQKEITESIWQTSDIHIPIISYYLNLKIKELRPHLNNWFADSVHVNAQIYNRQNDTFYETHFNLLSLQRFSLN